MYSPSHSHVTANTHAREQVSAIKLFFIGANRRECGCSSLNHRTNKRLDIFSWCRNDFTTRHDDMVTRDMDVHSIHKHLVQFLFLSCLSVGIKSLKEHDFGVSRISVGITCIFHPYVMKQVWSACSFFPHRSRQLTVPNRVCGNWQIPFRGRRGVLIKARSWLVFFLRY